MKVLFEKKGPIAYVTINRPERLNACDFEAYELLATIWREFRDDPALRVGILTGARSARAVTSRPIMSNVLPRNRRINSFRSCSTSTNQSSRRLTDTRTAAAWNKHSAVTCASRRSMRNLGWAKYVWAGSLVVVEPSDCHA